MKTLSIISYLFIFLPGSMILLPLALLLITGIVTAEPFMRLLVILADLSILTIFYISTKPKSLLIIAIELASFVFLIMPLLIIVLPWPLKTFNYFLFIAPFACFVTLYIVSMVKSVKEYRRLLKPVGDNSESR